MANAKYPGDDFSDRFCILDTVDTDRGLLMLRRWWSEILKDHVYDLMMGSELMMSNVVVVSEVELARQSLAVLPEGDWRVLIGGLGFGFTAQAALADPRVCEVTVIEYLPEVIRWHRTGLFPWSSTFIDDPGLMVQQGDFFAHIRQDQLKEQVAQGDVSDSSPSKYDAILLDIDDSPELLWHAEHGPFYDNQGLAGLHRLLEPHGVFTLWCATHPGKAFLEGIQTVFAEVQLIEIPFENPCLRLAETNYLVMAMGASYAKPAGITGSSENGG